MLEECDAHCPPGNAPQKRLRPLAGRPGGDVLPGVLCAVHHAEAEAPLSGAVPALQPVERVDTGGRCGSVWDRCAASSFAASAAATWFPCAPCRRDSRTLKSTVCVCRARGTSCRLAPCPCRTPRPPHPLRPPAPVRVQPPFLPHMVVWVCAIAVPVARSAGYAPPQRPDGRRGGGVQSVRPPGRLWRQRRRLPPLWHASCRLCSTAAAASCGALLPVHRQRSSTLRPARCVPAYVRAAHCVGVGAPSAAAAVSTAACTQCRGRTAGRCRRRCGCVGLRRVAAGGGFVPVLVSPSPCTHCPISPRPHVPR